MFSRFCFFFLNVKNKHNFSCANYHFCFNTKKKIIRKKSVEDLLNGSHEAIGAGLTQALSFTSGSILQSSPIPLRRSPVPPPAISPNSSPKPFHATCIESSTTSITATITASASATSAAAAIAIIKDVDQYLGNLYPYNDTEDSQSKSSESSNLATSDGTKPSHDVPDRPKSSKLSERAKKKSWYSVLYPSYKSRSEDFKKLFKGVPDDERLVVGKCCAFVIRIEMPASSLNRKFSCADYSCAVQRDILVHGRLYVSQNYLCFYANIFRWETCLCIKWKDVTAITKEKTARVIPNAILVSTVTEKHFITSFTSRDKAYLMLFRVWQNALMGKPMQPQEMWQWVCAFAYGSH